MTAKAGFDLAYARWALGHRRRARADAEAARATLAEFPSESTYLAAIDAWLRRPTGAWEPVWTPLDGDDAQP